MTTQKYLSQLERYDIMIENKKAERQRYSDQLYSISSPPSDNERVAHSLDPDKIGKIESCIDAINNEITDIICQMLNKKNTISKQIDEIDDIDHYRILHDRYISGKSLDEMDEIFAVSRRTLMKKISEAENEFERKFGSIYR